MFTTKERISQFIDYKGFKNYPFEQKVGLTNGALKKKGGISSISLEKIHKFFPELNMDWLITGRGEMLVINQNQINMEDNAKSIAQKNLEYFFNLAKSSCPKNVNEFTYFTDKINLLRVEVTVPEVYASVKGNVSDEVFKRVVGMVCMKFGCQVEAFNSIDITGYYDTLPESWFTNVGEEQFNYRQKDLLHFEKLLANSIEQNRYLYEERIDTIKKVLAKVEYIPNAKH